MRMKEVTWEMVKNVKHPTNEMLACFGLSYSHPKFVGGWRQWLVGKYFTIEEVDRWCYLSRPDPSDNFRSIF